MDAAELEPGGPYATAASAFQQRLTYTLDANSQYIGGVTVINTDEGFLGDLLRFMSGTNPVQVDFTARIETAKGVYTSSFSIEGELPVGGWMSAPWNEFGPMQGPGTVTITATNRAAYYTSVIVGANRLTPWPP